MNLDSTRKKIDSIDIELLKLLNERMELSLRTKKFKQEIKDAIREKEVLENSKRAKGNLLDNSFIENLFSQIIDESVNVQKKGLKLMGFQGEHGAYSEMASRIYDNSNVNIPCNEFPEIFEGVKTGFFDFGIVPVENSIEGSVNEVNDLLVETDLKIIGEVSVPIHHCLLILPESDYRNIKVVYSHPQALAQCRNFLSRNKLEPRPFYDTAGAARMLSQTKQENIAVIASRLSAELYNLEVLKENIEDNASNSTRFLVIARDKSSTGGKCSIAFKTAHKAGALFGVLKIFSDENINLTRIESRPIRNDPGKYAFLLDFEGSDKEGKIISALEKVKKETIMLNILGCYK